MLFLLIKKSLYSDLDVKISSKNWSTIALKSCIFCSSHSFVFCGIRYNDFNRFIESYRLVIFVKCVESFGSKLVLSDKAIKLPLSKYLDSAYTRRVTIDTISCSSIIILSLFATGFAFLLMSENNFLVLFIPGRSSIWATKTTEYWSSINTRLFSSLFISSW